MQLIAQDRHDDARHILLALLPNKRPDEDFVNREMAEIQHAVDEEREAAHGSSYKALLKNGPQKFFYRTMLGIGGQFMQQLSYVHPIFNFLPSVTGSYCRLENHISCTCANRASTQGNQPDHLLCTCHL